MMSGNRGTGKRNRILSYAGFIVLLFFYCAIAVVTPLLSGSKELIAVGEARMPVSAFTGVLFTLANIFLILLVVFYKKQGFIIALVILLIQFPLMTRNIIGGRNFGSIPGFFMNLFTIIAVILIHTSNRKIEALRTAEVNHLKEQQLLSKRLFEQTATALVTAIDAKDEYSHGHSLRVAGYSKRLAELLGKNEEECEQVYYAGLLHDVGKLGISDSIITKKGKLTPEEYEEIMQHPVMGSQILSTIEEHPYLSLGAHYHHERYDGKGYPDGLKGEDIPEIARIISVADAYDTMSSNRNYRSAIPQQLIREEIVKGAGTQFDPRMARLMQHLIDLDTEFRMKEWVAARELAHSSGLSCGEYRSAVTDGIVLTPYMTRIHLKQIREASNGKPPVIILFDSLDGICHSDEKTARELVYYEFCEISLDGKTAGSGVREIRTEIIRHAEGNPAAGNETEYEIEAVKCRDHVLIRIDDGSMKAEVIAALPDTSRAAYIGLTGEHCLISGLNVSKADEPVSKGYIPRIADEISYIDGPEGDIPNVQVESFRTASSKGIRVTDGLKITFRAKSLPTARLIWHCPYIDLYRSADGKMSGEDFREYALIRFDGESWEENSASTNELIVYRTEAFRGWDAWKQANREGCECTVEFRRKGNVITTVTENHGISLKNITTINEDTDEVYAALTGDQVALTNIRISEGR